MTDIELRNVLSECLPEAILKRNGQLLYSGIETLRPGDFYFVGFNPAADGTNPILHKIQLDRRQWSAYKQQCWSHPHCNETCPKAGQAPHQKRVRSMMSALGLIPERTFATNLIFVESRNVAEIKKEIRMNGLFEYCWRVHEKILAVVRPKYIVCLGNGESGSAFSLVRRRAKSIRNVIPGGNKVEGQKHVGLKSFDGTFALTNAADLDARVIGVPHPSRWNCPAGLDDLVYHREMA
jgi:hypothetical protein